MHILLASVRDAICLGFRCIAYKKGTTGAPFSKGKMSALVCMSGTVELDELVVVERAAGLLGAAADLVHQVQRLGAADDDSHVLVTVDHAAAAGVFPDDELASQSHLGRIEPLVI